MRVNNKLTHITYTQVEKLGQTRNLDPFPNKTQEFPAQLKQTKYQIHHQIHELQNLQGDRTPVKEIKMNEWMGVEVVPGVPGSYKVWLVE